VKLWLQMEVTGGLGLEQAEQIFLGGMDRELQKHLLGGWPGVGGKSWRGDGLSPSEACGGGLARRLLATNVFGGMK